MSNNNANLIKKLLNNSWEQPAITLEQAEAKIAAVEFQCSDKPLSNRYHETKEQSDVRIQKFLSQYGANGRYV